MIHFMNPINLDRLGRLAVGIAISAAVIFSSAVSIAESEETSFSYDSYALVLKTYVDDRGMVDYKGLKADSESLDTFTKSLESLEVDVYNRWNEEQKVAFWLNAYNALTLKAIIDHYPIKSSPFKSLRFPKNSIRQISGVWDKLKFPVMGSKKTLDEIEHEILRKEFNEPRIHMALVCAAIGCPPLLGEPYNGDKLELQLDDQARRFLALPEKFRIDRDKKRVYLSPIFKWFGDDFVPTYGTDEKFDGYNRTERAVLNFVTNYLSPEDRDYLTSTKLSIKHLGYDWLLNEQQDRT